MNKIKHLIALSVFLLGVSPAISAPAEPKDVMEAGFEKQIENLDKQTEAEPNIEKAKDIAKQGQAARRNFAAYYHKQKKFDKIIPIYQGLIERDKQLLNMGAVSNRDIAQDYHYLGDILYFLDRSDEAEKAFKSSIDQNSTAESIPVRKTLSALLRRTDRASEANQIDKDIAEMEATAAASKAAGAASAAAPGAPKVVNVPELARVKEIRAKAAKLLAEKHPEYSEQHLLRALGLLEKEITPEVERKMKAKIPGYGLDQWHACMIEESDVYKDLSELYYKQKKFEAVRTAYDSRMTLRMQAGIPLADSVADYAYLATLCQHSGAVDSAIKYNVILLKATRSKAGNENNAEVLSTMDKFSEYLKKNGEADKAAKLDARAKAIRSGSNQLPELWFSY